MNPVGEVLSKPISQPIEQEQNAAKAFCSFYARTEMLRAICVGSAVDLPAAVCRCRPWQRRERVFSAALP